MFKHSAGLYAPLHTADRGLQIPHTLDDFHFRFGVSPKIEIYLTSDFWKFFYFCVLKLCKQTDMPSCGVTRK